MNAGSWARSSPCSAAEPRRGAPRSPRRGHRDAWQRPPVRVCRVGRWAGGGTRPRQLSILQGHVVLLTGILRSHAMLCSFASTCTSSVECSTCRGWLRQRWRMPHASHSRTALRLIEGKGVRPLTVGFSCLFLEWRRIFMPSTAHTGLPCPWISFFCHGQGSEHYGICLDRSSYPDPSLASRLQGSVCRDSNHRWRPWRELRGHRRGSL